MNSLLQDLRYGARALSKKSGILLIAVLTLATTVTFADQDPSISIRDRAESTAMRGRQYRLVIATSPHTFASELNRIAKEGFRAEHLRFTSEDGSAYDVTEAGMKMVAILERVRPPVDDLRYEYDLFIGQSSRVIEERLDWSAERGWRLRALNNLDYVDNSDEETIYYTANVVILERKIGETASNRKYRVMPSWLKTTMQNHLNQAQSDGYCPVEVTFTGEPKSYFFGRPISKRAVVLEHPADRLADAEITHSHMVISTFRLSTLEKEINQAAKNGFRVERVSLNIATAIMHPVRREEGGMTFQYRVVGIRGKGKGFAQTLAREMSNQSAAGLEYLGMTRGTGGRAAVFEGSENPLVGHRPEYLVISDTFVPPVDRESWTLRPWASERPARPTLQDSLDKAVSNGYRVRDLVLTKDLIIIVLEKAETGARKNHR